MVRASPRWDGARWARLPPSPRIVACPRARRSSRSATARSRSATRTRSTSRKAGHTKLDLVRYFVAVADGALTGVRGRPMALKRFVDGAEKEPFFQKRAPENTPRVDPDGDAHLPVGPDGRRDRARRGRRASPGSRTSAASTSTRTRSAPRTWTTPTSCGWTSTRCPACPGRRCARSRWSTREALEAVGLDRLAEDVRARAGIHINVRIEPRWTYGAGPPGGAGAGPRRRAAGALDRDLEVVEGGAPRGVPRLQPEREGPDGRVRVLGPAHARRPRLVPAALGRGAGRRDGGLHARHGARRSTPSGATPGRGSTRPSGRWRRCSSCRRATRRRARATRRGRRTTRSRRASRRGSSRRRKRKADADVRGPRQGRRSAARGRRGARRRRRGGRPERRAADRVAGLDAVADRPPQVERAGDRDRAGPDQGRGLRGARALEGAPPRGRARTSSPRT